MVLGIILVVLMVLGVITRKMKVISTILLLTGIIAGLVGIIHLLGI